MELNTLVSTWKGFGRLRALESHGTRVGQHPPAATCHELYREENVNMRFGPLLLLNRYRLWALADRAATYPDSWHALTG